LRHAVALIAIPSEVPAMTEPSDPHYSDTAPSREEVDAMRGPVLVEFGNDWCGHCRAAAPHVARALDAHPAVTHLRIADGRGKRLGRTFAVKLWPTLVFMKDGVETGRLVRPGAAEPVSEALAAIDSPGA